MPATIRFDLVLPDKIAVSKDVLMIVAPGTDGRFGVLPRHMPMLSSLQPGVVDIHEDDKHVGQFFIGRGYAEVLTDRVTILADTGCWLKDINLEEVQKEHHELCQQLAEDEVDQTCQAELTKRIEVLEAMMEAALH